MRLINIHSKEMEEFFESAIPDYFILSHRWEGKEITYKDYVKGRERQSDGFKKVARFCELAKMQCPKGSKMQLVRTANYWKSPLIGAVSWVWVDTCEMACCCSACPCLHGRYRLY
jgi:hypothetical protein